MPEYDDSLNVLVEQLRYGRENNLSFVGVPVAELGSVLDVVFSGVLVAEPEHVFRPCDYEAVSVQDAINLPDEPVAAAIPDGLAVLDPAALAAAEPTPPPAKRRKQTPA